MRILIASDLHANLEAVTALPKDYDELWVLGDLVNYGPNPAEVVDFVQGHAAVVVRGNHDHLAGFGGEPRCSAPFRKMAEEMGTFTAGALSGRHKAYLRSLPLTASRSSGGTDFFLCHATPEDPLYDYCPPESERWPYLLHRTSAACLLVGHTHLQFRRSAGDKTVVNPGSVGQAKMGRPEACWALLDGDKITFHSAAYDVSTTIERLQRLDVSPDVRDGLCAVLLTGAKPVVDL
jgi:protein phosphatase